MFDLFDGLPVHALVVHAVVVLAPLTALLAIGYALLPRRRLGLRWPLVTLAVLSGVSGWVAGESGEQLERRLTQGAAPDPLLHAHTEAGDLLKAACLVFMVLVLLAVLWLLRPTPVGTSTGAGATSTRAPAPAEAGPLALITAIVLTLASLGVVYQTVVTGHTGARAVWSSQVSG